MGPKKRDRPQVAEESKVLYDHVQSDHEMFLQAFEKPTQIYRYLRTRSLYSPIFLQRTLSYMIGRCTRKSTMRSTFDVNSILSKVEAEHKKHQTDSYKSEYLNLTFSGFFDKESVELRTADVEVSVLKICHKRRKDVSSPVLEITVGKVSIPCNPTAPMDWSTLPTVSISSDNFYLNGSNSVKSYVILLRVIAKRLATCRAPHKTDTGSDLENQGPPRKKLRSFRDSGSSIKLSEDSLRDFDMTSVKTYSAELVVYDKRHRCLLTEGEYELALEELMPKMATHKHATWETVTDGKNFIPFEIFTKSPIVKFSLVWKKTQVNELELDRCVHPVAISTDSVQSINSHLTDIKTMDKRPKEMTSPSKRKRIFYQFLYNNNMRQQTEARDDCRCPWCYLSCLRVSALLSHLRCCHSRFNFTYVDHPKGGRIDVSINDCYDGSYVGNPQDLHSHIGYAFSRNGPVRRMSVTHILVSRRAKSVVGVSDFMESDGDCQKTRHAVQGHNRLYYHTLTCRPIRPSEIDIDSEEENYPEWLRQKTQNMIDEFTDVNEGEKEVMKIWNLHVMKHNFISDCQIPKACSTFVDEYGADIVHRKLGRNFLLHLVNLSDFGLLRPSILQKIAVRFFQLSRKQAEGVKTVITGASSQNKAISVADSTIKTCQILPF